MTDTDCLDLGGAYAGDGTPCGTNGECIWSSVTGACCLADLCLDTTESHCSDLEGDYQGDLSTCSELECSAGGTDCPGDADGNGVVDVLDLLKVIEFWGMCP